MKENTENSLMVLGFLLLLSIYGLVTYFNEDEVLELFAFVAQHKISVELFGTLGFANKVS
ncbi:frigida-LIKE protein, partial [Trifolium medium]|nr:frigida-LIKE protein [Trifolium medium]